MYVTIRSLPSLAERQLSLHSCTGHKSNVTLKILTRNTPGPTYYLCLIYQLQKKVRHSEMDDVLMHCDRCTVAHFPVRTFLKSLYPFLYLSNLFLLLIYLLLSILGILLPLVKIIQIAT